MKKPTVSSLKKKCDKYFSEYIRQRDNGVCITCGTTKPWKEMQAGHYWSRSYNSTRFDPENVYCQCVGCNVFKSGNKEVYSLRLIEKGGVALLDDLSRRRLRIKQFNVVELQGMIESIKQKTKELK